jgi:uroporphyrinogen III methyltransferase / synthase
VVTRAIEQTADLLARLTSRGAVPISLPLVSFAPPEDDAPLDAALDQLKSFDWIVFTSANAVHAITTRAETRNRPAPRTEEMPQVAVVGPATKSEATAAGFPVTYVAKTHLGTALAEELGERLRNKSVFLPRSDRANPDLPVALRKLGANLTEVIAYRTFAPADTTRARANAVLDGEADAILFFSPSAVHNFADLAGRVRLAAAQEKLAVIAVGPITASALREIGVHRISIAADTTTAAVVDALTAHFAEAPTSKSALPKSSARTGVNRR